MIKKICLFIYCITLARGDIEYIVEDSTSKDLSDQAFVSLGSCYINFPTKISKL